MDEEKASDTLPPAEFYEAGAKYWESIPGTIGGMLGGFGFVSQMDITGSTMFLNELLQQEDAPSKEYALDCGAGIGRVTKYVLLKQFNHVDLVEQNPKFLEVARTLYLNTYSGRIENFFASGLQSFSPHAGRYDVIWCQWVLSYLMDDDLINFFGRCVSALRKNGLIIVKENVTESDHPDMDVKDSSITRPLLNLKDIFRKAGLQCVREERQYTFPRNLYPVYMFALKSVLSST